MRRVVALFLLCLSGVSWGEEGGVVTGFLNKTVDVEGGARKYVVYVPSDYTADKAWPMIVFLHGAGERGDDGLVQSEVGIGEAIRRHAAWFPAIVVMPQCPAERFWDAAVPAIEGAMAQTEQAYNIDKDRVYLTGLSMGGYMTWIWGALKTDTFAAYMPICGGGNLLDIQKLLGAEKSTIDFGTLEERVKKIVAVPIWAFHGAKDSVVPVARTQQMVRLVKEAGGEVKYTEFPDLDHNSWDAAYGDEEAVKWLFKQKRKKG